MCNLQMSWDSVYQIWQTVCEELYEPILSNSGFKTYEFSDIFKVPEHYRNNGNFLYWLQIEELEQTIEEIPQNGLPEDYNKKACTNTAKMLFENQDNPEALALIWIGAFLLLYDKDSLYKQILFRNLNRSCFKELKTLVLKKMKELGLETWSLHTKYPVPSSLIDNEYLEAILSPTNVEELICMIALEASFLRTRWQLVAIRLI